MNEALKKLLESQVLDEDTKTALSEAWESKLEEAKVEAKKAVEVELREEFAQRYEHDRSQLVEAMDKFITEHVKKEIEEFAADRKSLTEERAKLNKAITEAKKLAAAESAKNIKMLNKFVTEQLAKELAEFNTDRKALAEEKVAVSKKLRETRLAYQKESAQRINKLEKFVLRQLTNEVAEFVQDKKLLNEQRARLIAESKTKLDETRKNFIKRAATLTEARLESAIRKELVQLKDDLKIARENNFGRRIFEAFGAEFMTSYLAEGTKVKAMSKDMKALQESLAVAQKEAKESRALYEATSRKVKLAEDQAQRVTIMTELLAPLSKENRSVMTRMLEGVKTEKLQEAYKKSLPAVLKVTSNDTPRRTTVLAETRQEQHKVAFTGDRNNKLAESVKTETNENPANNAEIIELRRLAGLDK